MAVARLQKELKLLSKDPLQSMLARPHPNNLLEWHYCLEGASDTAYAGGTYHGKIIFPKEYPFKPPSIMMCTPSGRFQPNTRLCLSMSDFHPESWNPMWSLSSIMSGLQSFMVESTPTQGSVNTTNAEKRQLAAASMAHNVKNATFRKLYPDVIEAHAAAAAAAASGGGGGAARGGTPTRVAGGWTTLEMVKHAIVGVAIAWMVYKNVRRLTSGEDDDDGLDAVL